jgi:endonuclease YncB( thermonuclease family)
VLEKVRLAVLSAALLALAAGQGAWARDAAERVVVLNAPPHRVVDGDTFEADLNGDGHLEFPLERVRLLYVDTPELGDSPKGKDLRHGLPARDSLKRLLARPPIRLHVPSDNPTGKYGRTLALVEVPEQGGRAGKKGSPPAWRNVSLALIREGHSPFDTRFSFPPDYERYAQAEGEAFDARRGIWGDKASRDHYLKRLQWERKTPAGRSNRLYVRGTFAADDPRLERLLGRYVHLEGRLVGRKLHSKGVVELLLDRGAGRPPFPAVAFRDFAGRLGVNDWRPGEPVRLEGFPTRTGKRPSWSCTTAARAPESL